MWPTADPPGGDILKVARCMARVMASTVRARLGSIPDCRPLADGDIVNLDVSVYFDGTAIDAAHVPHNVQCRIACDTWHTACNMTHVAYNIRCRRVRRWCDGCMPRGIRGTPTVVCVDSEPIGRIALSGWLSGTYRM